MEKGFQGDTVGDFVPVKDSLELLLPLETPPKLGD